VGTDAPEFGRCRSERGTEMGDRANTENLLNEGIAAAKAGRVEEARDLLTTVLDLDPENERAWLWMSAVVPDDEKAVCLGNVLGINPFNELARLGLASLLEKRAAAPETSAYPSQSEPPFAPPPHVPQAEGAQVLDDKGSRGRRSCLAYVGLALLAAVALVVCAVAALMGAMVLVPPTGEPVATATKAALVSETWTALPQLTFPPTHAPAPTRTPVPTNTLVVPEARIPGFPIVSEGAYDEVGARVQGLRGLDSLSHVQLVTWTRYRLEGYLQDWYARPGHLEEMESTEQLYMALGLIEEDYDLAGNQIQALREHIAGLYDTETKEIYLILDRYTSDLWLEVTLAHEFTHALQDQHFGLSQLYEDCPTSDCRLARQALVEGDATLVMTEYAFRYLFELSFERSELLSAIQQVEQGEYTDAPTVVRETASFPYAQGVVFAASLVERGGWEQLDQAFRQPPQTTEQLMHPDKYLAGEAGRAPEVGDPAGLLGPGWRESVRDSLGELLIRVYLERELDSEQALRAAEGWEGDTAVLLVNDQEKRYVLVLRVSWDSQGNAGEFLSLYNTFLHRARAEVMTGAGAGCWRDDYQVTCLSEHGSDTLVVLASDAEGAEKVLSGFPGF